MLETQPQTLLFLHVAICPPFKSCISSVLQDKEPRGIIPLENLSIREVEEPRKPVSNGPPLISGLSLAVYQPDSSFTKKNVFVSFIRTVSSSTIRTTKVRWSKPARRRLTDELWKATTWFTGYRRRRRKKKRSGSNPSSKRSCLNVGNAAQLNNNKKKKYWFSSSRGCFRKSAKVQVRDGRV